MAAAGSITISGTFTGLPSGSKSFGDTITPVTPIDAITDVVLASGDNTIAVPAGATSVLIQPPSGNVQALLLKGAGGDSGVGLHPTWPTLLSLRSGTASFILNAAALTSGATVLSFA